MNRRDLVCAAPLALLPIAAPGQADAIHTTVMKLFRKWQTATAEEAEAYRTLPDTSEGEAIGDTLWGRRRAIEEAMMAAPCENARDFAMKVIAWTSYGLFALPNDLEAPGFWTEARALIS